MSDSNVPPRPSGVPEAASWHAEWEEWVLGKKDGDACVGEWNQWHGTEGHLTCTDLFDDAGQLLQVTRFHPDGTFSQKVPHRNGKPHGVADYQRSNNPSEERSMEGSPEAVFRLRLYWEDGDQPRPARFFNEAGEEIGGTGKPKPKQLHPEARSNKEGLWTLNQAALQEAYEGIETAWRADGSMLFEQHFDDDGTMRLHRQFHPDGEPASERDYKAKTGWYRNAAGQTDIDPPKMPGDAHEVRFNIDVVNPKTGLFWPRDQVFYDRGGKELSDTGLTIRKPHADAYFVKEDTWHQPKTYWRHDEEQAGKRTTSTWRREGTLVFKTVHEGDHLLAHTTYDEAGAMRIEEEFHPREESERPVNRCITFHSEGRRLVVACDDDGACKTFSRFEGGECVETIDNETLGEVTLETFAAEFDKRFDAILEFEGGVAWFDFFDIAGLEVEQYDEFFKAATLAGNGAGDEILVVLEGTHAGEVFFNAHDEGLYALECVDDYIDEEEIDVEELSKDELIESMPFMEYVLAPSLSAFLRGIKVNAHRTYWKNHGEFVRIDPEGS